MECDKEHYFSVLSRKKRLLKFTDSSQKFILSLLHQLKHMSTGFDNSKVMIMIWKTKNVQSKKFKDAELQALLDEYSARTFEELAEALNVGKSIVFDR